MLTYFFGKGVNQIKIKFKSKIKGLMLIISVFILNYSFCDITTEFKPYKYLVISKDNEAVTHISLKSVNSILDDFQFDAYAPDGSINNYNFFEINNNTYLCVEYNYGSFGTASTNTYVDLYFFAIINDKIKFILQYNIVDISYNGKTKTYINNKKYFYYINESSGKLEINSEKDGHLIQIETIPIK